MINDNSIYSFAVVLASGLPQLLFLFINPKKILPKELYRGRYLVLALLSVFSFIGYSITVIFLSSSFGTIARLIIWIITSHTGVSLILLSWAYVIMHGCELRYMFKKFLLPCHMNVLIILVMLITSLLSLNFWSLIPLAIFAVSSYLWAFKAYKITKPLIDDDTPIREDYE